MDGVCCSTCRRLCSCSFLLCCGPPMTINFEQARKNMVKNQVRAWEVLEPRVLAILDRIPRELFVPAPYAALAYADLALPLEHGEKMIKPVVEGRALQALALDGNESVLEIGTGSGYLTACLAELGREVLSVELHQDFVTRARQHLAAIGNSHAEVVCSEAVHDFDPGSRRFDAILVGGAVADIPERFLSWLNPGGRLFAVRGVEPVMHAVL
ncbi:MAG TPA: protein-L-isoaspartate O-methyltransferase, partial [Mizugakiibacter sp.]|nr:protein-L-isoaspartate O-methyltransferase [Mizugakiibacter sp.]